MKVVEHFTRAGDVLFRWRSYLPLLLLPLFVASFIGFHYPYDSHAFDLAWEIGCFVLSMAGLAVRMFTAREPTPSASPFTPPASKLSHIAMLFLLFV